MTNLRRPDEELHGTLVVLGAGVAGLLAVGVLDLVRSTGLIERYLGFGYLPAIATLLLLLFYPLLPAVGRAYRIAIVGAGLLALGGILDANGVTGLVARPISVAGGAALAAAVIVARGRSGRSSTREQADLILVGALLVLFSISLSPVALLFLGAAGLAIHHYLLDPIVALALSAARRTPRRAPLADPPPFDPGPDMPPPPPPFDPGEMDPESARRWWLIEEYLRNNFPKWDPVEPNGVIRTGSMITYIARKPDHIGIAQVATPNHEEGLAVKLELERGKGGAVFVSSDAPGFLITVSKPASEVEATFFDDAMDAYLGRLDRPYQIIVGIDWKGEPIIEDLDSVPHTIVAGGTGSGKSVWMHSMLVQLLLRNTPETLRILWADGGQNATAMFYEQIPHLWRPVRKNPEDENARLVAIAQDMLELRAERNRRQNLFESVGTSDLGSYNRKVPPADRLPVILLIIDEAASFKDSKAATDYFAALKEFANNGRKAGIRIVLGIQRPLVDAIGDTGIRDQMDRRVIFRLSDEKHSAIVLGEGDLAAGKLRGNGDGIFKSGADRRRFQGLFLPSDRLGPPLEKHLAVGDYVAQIIARDGVFDPGSVRATADLVAAARAEVARSHTDAIDDRGWLIMLGLHRAIEESRKRFPDEFRKHPFSARALLPFVELAVPEHYPLGHPFDEREITRVLTRVFGPPAASTGEWPFIAMAVNERIAELSSQGGPFDSTRQRPSAEDVLNRPRRAV